MTGIDTPLAGLRRGFNGSLDSAQNQTTNSWFHRHRDFLKVTDPAHSFPQFDSWPAAEYQSGLAGPFDPQRAVVHAVRACRRGLQAPDPDDHGPGRRGATLWFWTS